MAYPTEEELDALFFNEKETPTYTPPNPPSSKPLTTFSGFTALPAELRNKVYLEYFSDYFSTNPTIKINALGELVTPNISSTSHQLRSETLGYFTSYTQDSIKAQNAAFEAQIRDYDPKPLLNRLCTLSEKFSVPKTDLVHRTKVSLIGNFHFTNIMEWIEGYLADHKTTPLFGQMSSKMVDLPGFSTVDIFTGSISLVEAVLQYRACENKHANSVFWRREALEFLEHAGLMGRGSGKRVHGGVCVREFDINDCNEEISRRVFETMAYWHHLLRTEVKGKPGRKRNRMQVDGVGMADAMYAFWWRVKVGWTYGSV